MITEKIRWGIIGCGDVNEKKSGPAFNKAEHSELLAVMRRDREKVIDYATRHRVPKYYTDAYQLINDPDINAVYVATPPSSHEEYTIAALKAGKPVYVEKPMSVSAASCRRMWEAASVSQTRLSVAHYRRELPMFIKIKELIKEIGEVLYVNIEFLQPLNSNLVAPSEVNWRVKPDLSGGGLFHDMAPHHIDIMLYLFGHPLNSSGYSANRSLLTEVDDIVAGTIIFPGKIVCRGLWCFNVPGSESKDLCEITGTDGKIRFSFHGFSCTVLTGNNEKVIEFKQPEHIQQDMIAKVTSYFSNRSTINPCPAEEGVRVLEVMDSFTGK